MSYSPLASAKFASLCQSQMALLDGTIGAVCSVVYLTAELKEDWQARLFPFAIYPQTDGNNFLELPSLELAEIWQQSPQLSNTSPRLLVGDPESGSLVKTAEWSEEVRGRRLLLPLIHESKICGLLVAERQDRNWQETELAQVEEIARTMAVARWLDLQYQTTRERLAAEQNLRRRSRDRLDDLLHQLRNPLTAIRTFSKLLLKHSLPEKDRSIAKNILRQGDRFAELLERFETELDRSEEDSLLTLSATSVPLLEEGTGVSNFLLPEARTELGMVELNRVLEPLFATVEAIAAEQNITLIISVPDDLPSVRGEAQALREVFNNLIDNAIKYTPSGGKVEIASCRRETGDRDWLGIAIKDTGCGINSQDQEHIFERHYRGVQSEGDIPGSGLGLAIAKELIEQMQGKIELISPNHLSADETSLGTTFIVWLPLVKE